MSVFDGMKYVSGFIGENPQFAVPLNYEDGLLGRECPIDDCIPKYFKITVADEDEDEVPAHGNVADMSVLRAHRRVWRISHSGSNRMGPGTCCARG